MIHISDSLALPNDAVTQPFAFLARRGAGKSYGSMKLAEGMLDIGAQIVAIDPVGVWYSLRISTYLGELKRAELVQERGDGLYAIVLDLVAGR